MSFKIFFFFFFLDLTHLKLKVISFVVKKIIIFPCDVLDVRVKVGRLAVLGSFPWVCCFLVCLFLLIHKGTQFPSPTFSRFAN